MKSLKTLKSGQSTFALYLSSAVLCFCWGGQAMAQEGGGGRITSLEEVIVTAQKREETLQEAPLAISALGPEQLEARGVSSLGDLTDGAVPALKVHVYPNSGATLYATIRGISAGDPGSITTELPVGIYIDGVYLGRAQGLSADILDLERVEVLRGPQGTLYGRNSVAGAINLVTQKPAGEFSFKQTLTVAEDYDHWRSLTRIDLPASRGFSARISYLQSEHDGWVENTNSGAGNTDYFASDKEGGRFAVRWEISDSVTVDYAYDYSDLEVGQPYFQIHQLNELTLGEILQGRGNSEITSLGAIAQDLFGEGQTVVPTDPAGFAGYVGGVVLPALGKFGAINDQSLAEAAEAAASGEDPVQAAEMFIGGAYLGSLPGGTANPLNLNEAERNALDLYIFGDQFPRFPIPGVGTRMGSCENGCPALSGFYFDDAVATRYIGADPRGSALDETRAPTFLLPTLVDIKGHTLHFNWQLSENVSLRSITSYRELDQQLRNNYAGAFGLFANGGIDGDRLDQEQFSQEFQILGNAFEGRFEYIAGVYYYSEQIEEKQGNFFTSINFADISATALAEIILGLPAGTGLDSLDPTGMSPPRTPLTALPEPVLLDPTGDPVFARVKVDADTRAIFGQGTWAFNDRLELTIGLRYTEDERDVNRFVYNPNNFDAEAEEAYYSERGIESLRTGTREVEDEHVDYSVAVAYEWQEDVSVYARFATGYKAGGVSRRSRPLITYDDETIETVELGLKGRFWDQRVSANIAVFSSEYEDKQTAINDENPRASVADPIVFNAEGTVDISGLEMEWSVVPLEGLLLSLDYNYLDWDFPRQMDQDGFDADDDPDRFVLEHAPRHAGTFSVDYTFQPFSFGTLALHFDWNSSDDYFYAPRHFLRTDGRDVLNARITLREIPIGYGQLQIALWGKNITDELYPLVSQDQTRIAGTVSDAYARPQLYGLDVTWEY